MNYFGLAMPRSLAVTFPGDACDVGTFGGITFYLIQALSSITSQAGGLDLTPSPGLLKRRYIWNAKEVFKLKGRGGYQYSSEYLNDIWRNEPLHNQNQVVINLFQMYSDRCFFDKTSKKVFYIDQTLKQLFATYPESRGVSETHRQAAISRERTQYHACDLVICMCQWAADSVIHDYGVAPTKVAVVKPGGNIDLFAYRQFVDSFEEKTLQVDGRLRFIFVGKDPARKGLFRFLDAMALVPNSSESLSLTVIGPQMEDIPGRYRALSNVEWLGRIDKSKDLTTFMNVVSNHHIGVLLSTAEAGGISLCEFQMFGLAVLAPNVGGSPEMLAPGAGELIGPSASSAEIATCISNLISDPEKVTRMRQAAWRAREHMTAEQTAVGILTALKSNDLI